MRGACRTLIGVVWLGLAVIASAADVTLSWLPNTESDLAGYKIYQSTVSGQYGAPVMTVGKVTTQTLALPSLTVDTTYYHTITAYDLAGNESVKSAEVSKFIAGVSAVVNPGTPVLTVAAKDTELLVAWAPVSDGAGGTALLDIRLGSATDQWGVMVSQNCPASPCRITGLTPSTAYQVQSVAYRVDTGKNVFGPLSVPVSVHTTAPIDLPPAPPTGLQITQQSAEKIVLMAKVADCPRGVRTSFAGSTTTLAQRTITCLK